MKLTANRVVVILHTLIVVLTIAAAFIVTVTNSLPQSWQKTATLAVVVVGALSTAAVTAIKYLDGSQKWDQLQAQKTNLNPPV